MTTRFIAADADIVSRCRGFTRPGLYTILPRANRVVSTLPNMKRINAHVLATPQVGARFVQHELLIDPGGSTLEPINDGLEQFLFVLEGALELELEDKRHSLVSGGYAWLPPGHPFELRSSTDRLSRVIWLRRRYESTEGVAVPDALIGNEKDVTALPEDTYLEQRLIPYEEFGFDMALNVLNFEPGVCFGFVESHIMEHGLYMVAGRGIYWLSGNFHEVEADDFIYMAPYCPQYFCATGQDNARYLIYKEANRDYSAAL